MSTRVILEIFGWIGSGLIVLSLAQARVWRFRIMNFVGAVIATVYNFLLEIWPFGAMNLIIAIIDAYWLVRLSRERRPESTAYDLLEVHHDDAFLRHFLGVHGKDAKRHFPDFDPDAASRSNVLVMRGDEAVGVVTIADIRDGTADISLDYVTERFRDFTPGTFVYQDSGMFERLGVRKIQAPASAGEHYLKKMGFREDAGTWIREVAPTGPSAQ
ncbi:MAG: hypothetical protein H6526_06090 [Actinobacteria bacterium]|nr:hypothetical protein [Actinomycetota bacterium]MCB8997560.1 hypothetical protein [Actinomycetota bacterium]MCB9414835.1 hypothetical protein [Actinomycetota bacterium]HRY11722.1 hypothetical protein [Candidatus Nanopelagicales bacterium]